MEFLSLSEYEKCILLESVRQVLLYENQIQQQFHLSCKNFIIHSLYSHFTCDHLLHRDRCTASTSILVPTPSLDLLTVNYSKVIHFCYYTEGVFTSSGWAWCQFNVHIYSFFGRLYHINSETDMHILAVNITLIEQSFTLVYHLHYFKDSYLMYLSSINYLSIIYLSIVYHQSIIYLSSFYTQIT